MTAALPFPIALQLPPGWEPVDPAAAGEPDAGYVAVRTAQAPGPVPTSLVISGLTALAAATNVRTLSEAHVQRLRTHLTVTVLSRESDTAGTQAAQLLRIDGGPVPLNQIQIVMAYPDTENAAVVGILQVMFSCPADVFAVAGPEFRGIIAGLQVGPSAAPQ